MDSDLWGVHLTLRIGDMTGADLLQWLQQRWEDLGFKPGKDGIGVYAKEVRQPPPDSVWLFDDGRHVREEYVGWLRLSIDGDGALVVDTRFFEHATAYTATWEAIVQSLRELAGCRQEASEEDQTISHSPLRATASSSTAPSAPEEHGKRKEGPGRHTLDRDEIVRRVAYALRAEEMKKEDPTMGWKEIAQKIEWPHGHMKSGVKLLEEARKRLARYQADDPDGILVDARALSVPESWKKKKKIP